MELIKGYCELENLLHKWSMMDNHVRHYKDRSSKNTFEFHDVNQFVVFNACAAKQIDHAIIRGAVKLACDRKGWRLNSTERTDGIYQIQISAPNSSFLQEGTNYTLCMVECLVRTLDVNASVKGYATLSEALASLNGQKVEITSGGTGDPIKVGTPYIYIHPYEGCPVAMFNEYHKQIWHRNEE